MTGVSPAIEPADLIGGSWVPVPGSGLISINPANPDHAVWQGDPNIDHVDLAIAAAQKALPAWAKASPAERFAVLHRFAEIAKQRVDDIAHLICDETGKAFWDCKAEAGLVAAKVDITLDPAGGMSRVTGFDVPLNETRSGRCWFRSHGVMAVIGPFNFPAHLPNGHIIPALAMGNTVVFKPSDKTPAVGQLLVELLDQACRDEGAPTGIINLVQGRAEIASRIVQHAGIDGILFTGSWPVGKRILEANLDRPSRIIALEMGGNNAAIVMDDADLRQAVIECARCAFISTGQRCTCTRRIIVHQSIADQFITALKEVASQMTVGDPRANPPVFMGPIINDQSRSAVFSFERMLTAGGAESILEAAPVELPRGGYGISPGIVKVNKFTDSPGEELGDGMDFDTGCDIEIFGPLVRLSVTDSLDDAITQANATRFGLASSIFTRSDSAIERFRYEARAGCINTNCGTAGASSKLPFGGLGLSGNHRPAGSFSLDYCAFPVAGMIETGNAATLAPGMVEPSL